MSTQTKSKAIAPHLLPIEKNNDTKIKTLLTNIIKMLTERELLNKNNLKENINNITSKIADNLMYKINLDNYEHLYGKNNGQLIIKIFTLKIISLSKSSDVIDFFNKYKNNPKILVVRYISPKTQYQIQYSKVYLHTEIFLEQEMMINLIEHISVPKHILLSNEKSKKMLEEYHIKNKNLSRILNSDPVSRYYNAKPGQIFRIIRPSETSGKSIAYRLVIRGQINDYK